MWGARFRPRLWTPSWWRPKDGGGRGGRWSLYGWGGTEPIPLAVISVSHGGQAGSWLGCRGGEDIRLYNRNYETRLEVLNAYMQ